MTAIRPPAIDGEARSEAIRKRFARLEIEQAHIFRRAGINSKTLGRIKAGNRVSEETLAAFEGAFALYDREGAKLFIERANRIAAFAEAAAAAAEA